MEIRSDNLASVTAEQYRILLQRVEASICRRVPRGQAEELADAAVVAAVLRVLEDRYHGAIMPLAIKIARDLGSDSHRAGSREVPDPPGGWEAVRDRLQEPPPDDLSELLRSIAIHARMGLSRPERRLVALLAAKRWNSKKDLRRHTGWSSPRLGKVLASLCLRLERKMSPHDG